MPKSSPLNYFKHFQYSKLTGNLRPNLFGIQLKNKCIVSNSFLNIDFMFSFTYLQKSMLKIWAEQM